MFAPKNAEASMTSVNRDQHPFSHTFSTVDTFRPRGPISVREVLAVRPDTAEVFRRFGIEPARWADASLKEAALSVGADPQAVLGALSALDRAGH
jgi:hypothetical protein